MPLFWNPPRVRHAAGAQRPSRRAAQAKCARLQRTHDHQLEGESHQEAVVRD